MSGLFSSGPWQISGKRIYDSQQRRVADCHMMFQEGAHLPYEATRNMQLMRASPTLYTALLHVVLASDKADRTHVNVDWPRIIEEAKEALRLAGWAG